MRWVFRFAETCGIRSLRSHLFWALIDQNNLGPCHSVSIYTEEVIMVLDTTSLILVTHTNDLRHNTLALYGWCSCFLLQVAIGILLGPDYIGKMALIAPFGLFLESLLIMPIVTTIDLAHKYLLPDSMQSDAEHSLSWWIGLDEALRLIKTDIVEPLEMM